jgi:hypothetical protein
VSGALSCHGLAAGLAFEPLTVGELALIAKRLAGVPESARRDSLSIDDGPITTGKTRLAVGPLPVLELFALGKGKPRFSDD